MDISIPPSIGKAFDTYKEYHSATYGAGAAIIFLAGLITGMEVIYMSWTMLNLWVIFPFETDKLSKTLKMNVRGEEHYFIGAETIFVLVFIGIYAALFLM